MLSTAHYMRYNSPLLLQLEDKYTGAIIGSIQVPQITVADDLLLLSKLRLEMQDIIYTTEDFTNQDRYIIHPGKGTVLIYPPTKKKTETRESFKMSGKGIKVEQSTVHLGIKRDITNRVDIDEKISHLNVLHIP